MSGQDCEQLTLFQGDSPASRLVMPGSEEAKRTTVTSGLKCLELSKNSGPLGSLEKMLLASSTWHSTRCFLTWKDAATPAGRLLFRLVPSKPRTGGTDALSWPTPTASDTFTGKLKSSQQKPGSRHSLTLSSAVQLWPTPTAQIGKGPSFSKMRQGGPNLQTAAALYPTHTTGAGLCGGANAYKSLMSLEKEGQISEEERRSMAAGNGGQLNPAWVEAMMGFPPGWTALEPDGPTAPGRTG